MERQSNFFSSMPVVTRNLLIINFVCWVAERLLTSLPIVDLLGLHYVLSPDFHFWQPLTYMFMHANFSHLFFNMFAVFMFAIPLERQWGSKRFLIYYLVSGIGAGIVQELVWWLFVPSAMYGALTIGASGAVFGILLAFGWLNPEERLFIFPIPVPIRARWFVIIYAVVELFLGIANMSGDNVAHFAHLGGMLFGWILILIWKHMGVDLYSGGRYTGSSNFSFKQWWNKVTKNFKKEKASSNPYEGYHYQEPIREDAPNAKQEPKQPTEEERRETDRILDKLRHSGYSSLTEEEKAKLFKK